MDNEKQQNPLAGRDYEIAIDKSGSMSEPTADGKTTRWDYGQEQALATARLCGNWDDDGITVMMFDSKVRTYEGTTADKVKQLFKENQPGGNTATHLMLEESFARYLKNKAANANAKPVTLVVFTDGAPTDGSAVVKSIVNFTKKIKTREEFGISFVQIGDDPSARAFLKRLDDDLTKEGAALDIVDTKNEEEYSNMGIEQLLNEALTD